MLATHQIYGGFWAAGLGDERAQKKSVLLDVCQEGNFEAGGFRSARNYTSVHRLTGPVFGSQFTIRLPER